MLIKAQMKLFTFVIGFCLTIDSFVTFKRDFISLERNFVTWKFPNKYAIWIEMKIENFDWATSKLGKYFAKIVFKRIKDVSRMYSKCILPLNN